MAGDGSHADGAGAAKIGPYIKDSTPFWPAAPRAPKGAPNILVVLFDDVGFSDFGCYGSPIATPTIDRIASRGLRYSSFHTTAMCSTTRAALLTGRNHHSVGVGCLANFDSGYPGYRGKIAREAGTVAEMLRPHGYRNYMLGKWHVTPLTESGPTGPFDGWPLGRGFDRYYGFMDAETDQYAPELMRDNSSIPVPGTYQSGYHLTEDLVDQSIRFIADHIAARPDQPWLTWVAFGACHAPHQAPRDLIMQYDAIFGDGWDVERERRFARQKKMGLVPPDTRLPPRNDGVRAWAEYSADEQRIFTRLQAAFAAMLDHADRHLARLIAFLEAAKVLDDTLVLVLSDNGASQEGGPLGFINAMGPYNLKPEPIAEKLRRIDDIGGPDTHSNFPQGWAMASNTPLRRYKQNTHGGGIRDPLVISWPNALAARGEIRSQFCHACDLAPTLLELVGITRARSDCRRGAAADRRRELCRKPEDRNRAAARKTAVLRDVRPSRPVERGLEGRCLSSVGLAVRERQVGALSPRPRFLRDRRSCRARARAAEGDDRRMVAAGGGAQGAAAGRPVSGRALPRMRRAPIIAGSSCSTPASATSRPRSRRTCAAAPT